MKKLLPKSDYYLAPVRNNDPISTRYGFDRGTPIDRYYIEKFIQQHKVDIKGACLEITDPSYIKKYGGNNVTKADALDINTNNINATIYGDLRNLKDVGDETYDCLVITQTFVMIDDYESAVRECYRILKKGGVILATMPCLGPVNNIENNHWRWTGASGKYVFNKLFPYSSLEVKTYGNALSGQCFWVGLSQEELKPEELDYNDPYFPVIVAIRAIKK